MTTPVLCREVNLGRLHGEFITETVHRIRHQRQTCVSLRAQEQELHQVPHLESGGVDDV